MAFGESFLRILGKVFPLLLFPFFTAVLLRRFCPPVHRFLVGLKDMAFYLWAVALIIVMGQTTKSVVEGDTSIGEEFLIAFLPLSFVAFSSGPGKTSEVYTPIVSAAGRH